MSELSRASGVPVATVKYYLREGLVPPGAPSARNQADYDDAHVHRLRLIRALRGVGRMGIGRVRAVLEALDDEQLSLHDVLGVAHRALGPAPDRRVVTDEIADACAEVDRFIVDLGWEVASDAPARGVLADALVALRRLGRKCGAEVFEPYAEAAGRIAERELSQASTGAARADTGATRADIVEWMVVGTVVFEAALTALRRLAHEHLSSARFGS
ncbi:MAG: MerR family transcriptional regulator [Actinomycetota bacterium]